MFCLLDLFCHLRLKAKYLKTFYRIFALAIIVSAAAVPKHLLWGQEISGNSSVLHIQHSVVTAQTGFPQFIYTYHLLNGAQSILGAQALTGTISLQNNSANFSEVLWLLVYWPGTCPTADQG